MENIKKNIESTLMEMENENIHLLRGLSNSVILTSYKSKNGIWTEALQKALNEYEIVIIPASSEPYYVDDSIIIPSNRHIIAEDGATISLVKGTDVLMLRNANTADGTHEKITKKRSENITIEGGVWTDWCTHRMGYGSSGKYDTGRTFFGVSTLMLFENINHLTLKNMTFKNCGGFAIQLGEISSAVIRNIKFESCFADGVHVNGNVEKILISDISGEVADDLVAFNMFDWQNSSINFGPCDTALCQNLSLSKSSNYKALRIEPGIYTFDNGEEVDCSLTNAIFRGITGINTFKLYCQTPVYFPNEKPEPARVGSGDNIFFEDIKIDLDSPIDPFPEYLNGDERVGSFAAFELGLNAKNIYFKNINLTLYKEKFPLSYLVTIGPKSIRLKNGAEVFDPYFSSIVENLHFENITVNNEKPLNILPYVKEIEFDNLYEDIDSSASGKINNIYYK